MLYYCTLTAIIEVGENRILPVCQRQLCYFFSIQSHEKADPIPRGALPTMSGGDKRKGQDLERRLCQAQKLKI